MLTMEHCVSRMIRMASCPLRGKLISADLLMTLQSCSQNTI